MSEQYDYNARLAELKMGVDITFRTILEPFIFENIKEYIGTKPIANLLDVGCGCGYLMAEIKKKFPLLSVHGIDISTAAIECARANFDLRFEQRDIVDLNENDQFDIVVYNMVLHNLQALEPTILKTSRILKTNGIVLITIPHPAFWLEDKVSRGKIVLDKPFDHRCECLYQIPFKIANGRQHHTKLTYYHRMLSTYLNIFSNYLSIMKFEEVDLKNGFPTMLNIVLKKN